ncbi:MAG: Maf-like protein [Bacteroidales bacterium]|nr:Maf-like protein [Bacteroidales bacterium]
MLSNLKPYHIILASQSPRRRELLAGLGVDFETKVIPDIEESYPQQLPAPDVPTYIARQKAEAYRADMKANDLIITADTIVCCAGEIMGKPANNADARRMLHTLSGRTHQVITGVCITTRTTQKTLSTSTDVTFKNLTDEEIDYYITHFHPTDKAGSYGIQEWIGYIGVERIEGSYFNVMGLPIQRLYTELSTIK